MQYASSGVGFVRWRRGGRMKKFQAGFLSILSVFTLGIGLTGCGVSEQRTERYVSSQVEGEKEKINLEEVQKAFWETKAKDFNSWMGAFEKRVNEIYEGKEVVSIDANRKTGKLEVTGFIDDKKEAGYQDGEEKLFTISQTGDVTNDELPYRMSGAYGHPYYEGNHSILGSPIVQMMVLSHLMGGWGGRYYTPQTSWGGLRDYRDNYRTSPTWTNQRTANTDFHTRYKPKSSGSGFMSKKTFGDSSFSSSSSTSGKKRSWFGGSSSSTSSSSSGWGGRRSSRSWGGRRR